MCVKICIDIRSLIDHVEKTAWQFDFMEDRVPCKTLGYSTDREFFLQRTLYMIYICITYVTLMSSRYIM